MSTPESILVELGDVIQIIAPSNATINDIIYIIDYIDENIIKLINTESLTSYTLNIHDGTLTDESIVSINILDKPDVSGYAAQHDFTPGTWLDIYFSGDQPVVITGEITDLDNDMIEIKTFPDKRTIYIDFAYKGIPLNLPIEKINVREKPERLIQQEQQRRLTTVAEEEDSINVDVDIPTQTGTIDEQVPLQNIDLKLRAIFSNIQNIVLGEDLGQVNEVIELSANKQRFGIDTQTNDLLDDLLSTVPAADRTRSKLNDIHTMIQRFKQLRNMFSEFDAYRNITNPIIHGAQYKPLVNELQDLNTNLYWLLPVAVNKRKVFDIEAEIAQEIGDITATTLAELRISEDNIINTYNENNIPEGQNKYAFLMQNINQYLTPFNPPSYPDHQIINKTVKNDIPVIIDNQDDFYSSTASNNNILRTRFVMQNYNKGITQLEISDKTGSKFESTSTTIVPGDQLSLKSILMLPEPVIRFSHINLPATDILTKSDLSRHFVNYWQFLNADTFIDTVNIETFITPSVEEYQETEDTGEMFKQIREYTYIPSTNSPDDEEETYGKFLNTIVPKTRILFEKFRKYIKHGLSVHKVVEILEPFLIYYSDLTFKQYSEISDFIKSEIIEFKRNYIAQNRNFNALKLTKYRVSRVKPSLIKIFNSAPELFQQIGEYYGIIPIGQDVRSIKQFTYSDSELIHVMLRKDSMRAYMAAISLMNVNLHLDVDIDALLEQNAVETAENMMANMDANTCDKFVLSKKYSSFEELQIDNGNPLVYFDKGYDPTRYEILQEYTSEMESMPQNEFITFLTSRLQETVGLSADKAQREAMALLDGARLVSNDDYAILETLAEDDRPQHLFYKRVSNNWEQDTNVDSSVFADTNKMFCDTQLPCFQVNKACLNKNIATDEIKQNNIETMLKEFEFQYNFSHKELDQYIRLKLDRAIKMLPRLSKLNQYKVMKYNKQQFDLGVDIAERNIVVSPYASIRDIILGQSDFVKKQNDVIRFKHSFTRSPGDDENQYWFYCIETQIKLLPTFIFTLAEAFVSQQNSNNIEDYKYALDKVCADRGTVSEDGNSWVDKHSGYEIRTIEFDTDEGFEDTGYKMISREILEKDAGDHVLKGQEPEKIISDDTRVVHNVIRAISSFLSIDISPKIDFISTNTLLTLSTIVGSKRSYEEKSSKLVKTKGKALPPYKDMKNTILLMLTFAYLIVAIQVTIPSIKTRKTFPGCIKSFTGYPLQGDTDMSTVAYISCVANKIKSSVEPWNSLTKHSEKTISKKISDLINKYILPNNTIREMMREKQAYLLIEQEEYIPIQHEISSWTNFMPPLVPLKLPIAKPLSSGFEGTLASDIRSGSKEQVEDINAVRGKIIQFSLEIQKHIQMVVNEQDPILTNAAMEPFLANSCCNEEGIISTIGYFEKRQPDIISDNNYVSKLNDILTDIRFMRLAPFFYNNEDTRIKYPPLSDVFSEGTIYRAFIVYCKYNNNLPLDNDILRVCSDKPRNFDTNWSVKEKIQNLKEQGKIFDNESLMELMNVVNNRNMISMNLDPVVEDPIQNLRGLLENIEGKEQDILPMEFIQKFIGSLDTYETSSTQDSESLREFKNYLATQITTLSGDITREINERSTLSKSNKKIATTFIETAMTWSSIRKNDSNIRDEDSTLFNAIDFMKNILTDSVSVFPNIILNEVNYKDIKIPRHWSLSEKHQYDIKTIISTYYSGLKQFYSDPNLTPILTKIQSDCQDILDLIDKTLLIANISEISDNPFLNNELVGLLYNYYFVNTFYQYMLLGNSPQFIVEEQPILATSIEDQAQAENIDSLIDQLEAVDTSDISQVDITQGEDALIKGKIATLINSMINIFANTKRQINYNYESIMERVLRAKEKEKENVTQRLKDLTDEAREVDTEFKRHKLGDWGKGLEKGLTQYVRETYDQEREALDKRLVLEKQLNTKNIVSDMNMDIYVMDMEDQMLKDDEMDKDAYSMDGIEGENEDENENDGY